MMQSPVIEMKDFRERLFGQNHLSFDEMKYLAESVIRGEFSDSQLGATLMAMKINGITAVELAGFAEVMQSMAMDIPFQGDHVMDNCGTGGDHLNTFNVSTTAAFVLAGGGVTMAKHGNRSISSRSGSADVLEKLGIDINASAEMIGDQLHEIGIAFLFAPSMHPGMKAVMKVRQELGTPTIFNLLGPLINPVKLSNQLMGTYEGSTMEETALALGKLGRKRSVVVHGFGGMDEANLAGKTKMILNYQGQIEERLFTPEEVGLKRLPLQAIIGGGAEQNAEILVSCLENEPSPFLETVLLNAGLGFFASGLEQSIETGISRARSVIASGAAMDKLVALQGRK